jgi:hypothetical protein
MSNRLAHTNVVSEEDVDVIFCKILIDNGYKALINELGADGTFRFLRLIGAPVSNIDEFRAVLMRIGVSDTKDSVVIEFSKLVSWMSFGKEELKTFVDSVVSTSKLLKS